MSTENRTNNVIMFELVFWEWPLLTMCVCGGVSTTDCVWVGSQSGCVWVGSQIDCVWVGSQSDGVMSDTWVSLRMCSFVDSALFPY